MTAPRGSAEQANEIFRDAIARAKVIIDDLVKIAAASGHPPGTIPVTLADLKQMSEVDAVKYLQSELKRTMIVDPVTGDQKPGSPKVVELAVRYAEWRRGVTNGR